MEVIAKARYIRQSPRKVRLVVDAVRGKNVVVAKAQLRFMNKAAALPVLKLLDSAVANAEHNFKLDGSSLVIKSITADGGPVLHRWRARAFGRAAPIRKRTTHITIVLEDRGEKKAEKAVVEKKAVKKSTKASTVKKPAAKKAAAKS